MDSFGRSDRFDPGKAVRITIGQGAKGSGDSAMIFGRAPLNRISRRSACGKACRQYRLVAFKEDHPVGAQAIATKGVERRDGIIAQSPRPALIRPA